MRPCSSQDSDSTEVLCITPEIQNGRKVAGRGPVYRPRDTVRFECDPGYTLNGSRQIQCRDEGTWDPPVPVCIQEVLCITPEIQHGRKVARRGPVYRPRDIVRFECDPGYTLNGSRQIQCQDDRTWDPPVPVCIQALPCPPPPVIVKGKHNVKPLATFNSGTYVNYSCEPGYALCGEASIYCATSGTWSHPSPLCEEIRCAFPEVQGGKKAVAGTTYRFGTNVTVECDNGYVLEGSSLIQCQHDFTWNPPVPVCKSSMYRINGKNACS
nr:complement receptor type 2-like [Chrysemys picta bellii]